MANVTWPVKKEVRKSFAALSSYTVLRDRVEKRLALGRQEAEKALVRAYWDAGHMINTHIQIHKGRAEYGKKVIQNLATDLGIDDTVLWRMAEFAEAFPILARGRELPWSFYRVLLTVNVAKARFRLAREAEKKHWTKEKLEEEIKMWRHAGKPSGGRKASGAGIEPLPLPVLGNFHTYRIFQPKSIVADVLPLRVDLGFHVYVDLNRLKVPRDLKEGDIVSTKGVGAAPTMVKNIHAAASDLFTYRAAVEDVTDGDTLRVHIDLGLGEWVRQYLRLAHIDTPPVKTKAGLAARDFVLKELKGSPIVTLHTAKHDLFDRYVADIFLENGSYLNQRILDAGHAVRLNM